MAAVLGHRARSEYAVKFGGSYDRLALMRPEDDLQYPEELFKGNGIRLFTGFTASKESAEAEQLCIEWVQGGLVPGIVAMKSSSTAP